jgi:hypothetical protein
MNKIIAFKGQDEGFTVTFSEDDMRRFGITEGDFINISVGGEVTAKVKGGGKVGRSYLGEECWRTFGLTTAGTTIQFIKAKAKPAKKVILSIDGTFAFEGAIKSALLSEIVAEGSRRTKNVAGNTLSISIEHVVPEGCVLIEAQTKLVIKPKYAPKILPRERITSGTPIQPLKFAIEELYYVMKMLDFIKRVVIDKGSFELVIDFWNEQMQKIPEFIGLSEKEMQELRSYYQSLIELSKNTIQNLNHVEERMDEFMNLRGANETLTAIMEATKEMIDREREAKEKGVDVNFVNLIKNAERELALLEEAEKEARTLEMRQDKNDR